jgi:hypothetical protein
MLAKVSPLKGTSVDEYVAKLPAAQAEIVTALRQLIKAAAPKSTEAVKWAQPVFEENGPFAYIKPAKAHVTFGFWRGGELKDSKGVLSGDGDRMKHVRLTSASDIKAKELQALVKEAVKLNREKGDPTRRANR